MLSLRKDHPSALPYQASINLYTQGRQASIIRDSFLLMKQAAPLLAKGENVLYINTLTTSAIVEEVANKISSRYDREVCTYSASSRNVMQRLEFLEHTISSKNIKLVILNSFEFAAIYSRQKNCLATWLREMRDAYGIRVVVYSMHPEQTAGALGTLSFLADRIQRVGDWQYDDATSSSLNIQESSLEAGQEFSAMLDSYLDDNDENAYMVDRPTGLKIFDMSEYFTKNSLKNKELSAAPTRPSFVEVEEEELAMA